MAEELIDYIKTKILKVVDSASFSDIYNTIGDILIAIEHYEDFKFSEIEEEFENE